MKKRVIAKFIPLVLLMSLLSGCGKQGAGNETEAARETVKESAEAEVATEPETPAVDDDAKAEEENEAKGEEGETSVSERDDNSTILGTGLSIECAASDIIEGENGEYFVADIHNKKIWSIKDGKAEVYAGADSVEDIYGTPLGGYNDAEYGEALFKEPFALASFMDGIAVSDPENSVVRFIKDGIVQTVNPTIDGTKADLKLTYPTGLTTDSDGILYICDTHEGKIYSVDKEGTAKLVVKNLEGPMGISFAGGALYVAEAGANRISKITPKDDSLTTGNVLTEVIAGTGEAGFTDGKCEEAQFAAPQSLAAAEDGTIYVADTVNSAVRRIKDGEVTTILQDGDSDVSDYPVSPRGILIGDGEIYVCDYYANAVITVPTAE